MSDDGYLGISPVGSADWNRHRATGIGGSEVAAIVGLSPWVSPFALWHRKRGNLDEQTESPSMSWGKKLEPVVAEEFCQLHPEFGQRVGGMWREGTRLASPDLLLTSPRTLEPTAILEVKTADSHNAFEWGKAGSDEIPPYYRCQGIWYLDVLQLTECHFAVLIGGNDYREYVVEWNRDEADWLRERAEAFWQTVLDDHPPPLDSSDSTYEAVRELHPDIDGTTTALDPILWERFETAKTNLDDAKATHSLLRTTLTDVMGNARYGEVLGERVCIRQSTKGGPPYLKALPAKKEAA